MAGVTLSEGDFDQIVAKADTSQTGRINYKDFLEDIKSYVVDSPEFGIETDAGGGFLFLCVIRAPSTPTFLRADRVGSGSGSSDAKPPTPLQLASPSFMASAPSVVSSSPVRDTRVVSALRDKIQAKGDCDVVFV
jgi:hypothetical protein